MVFVGVVSNFVWDDGFYTIKCMVNIDLIEKTKTVTPFLPLLRNKHLSFVVPKVCLA